MRKEYMLTAGCAIKIQLVQESIVGKNDLTKTRKRQNSQKEEKNRNGFIVIVIVPCKTSYWRRSIQSTGFPLSACSLCIRKGSSLIFNYKDNGYFH